MNRLAAQAFLARVYLIRMNNGPIAAEATAVIESGVYQLETDLEQTFRHNSKEAILQFMPVMEASNTAEGGIFVPLNPKWKTGCSHSAIL